MNVDSNPIANVIDRCISILKLLLCFACVAMLTNCTFSGLPDMRSDPPSTQQAPLYPGASQVVTNNQENVHITSFETPDASEDVLNYYENIFIAEGWKSAGSSPQPQAVQTPQALYFKWYRQDGTGGWLAYVTVVQIYAGKTQVEIKIALDPGR
jgi:hypothetical protein